MSWLTNAFGAGAGSVVKSIGEVADRFITTDEDRARFQKDLQEVLQKRDAELEETLRTEIRAKEAVMVAELQQDDKYTKRSRPTLIYSGLVFIAICNVLFPFVARILVANGVPIDPSPLDLPVEFWVAWGGAAGLYIVGRSAEKKGNHSPLVKAVTGGGKRLTILD